MSETGQLRSLTCAVQGLCERTGGAEYVPSQVSHSKASGKLSGTERSTHLFARLTHSLSQQRTDLKQLCACNALCE